MEGFLYYEAYMAVVRISNHRGTIKFFVYFQNKSLVINHALNNIIVTLVSLSHIPQQLRLSSSNLQPTKYSGSRWSIIAKWSILREVLSCILGSREAFSKAITHHFHKKDTHSWSMKTKID